MNRGRSVLMILLVAGGILAVYLVLTGPGGLGPTPRPGVMAVPRSDREIAWIHTATSGAAWERFVAGARLVQQLRPELGVVIEDQNAFPEQTAAVPEIALGLAGADARLWIRWYKQTSDTGAAYWVHGLAERNPAPVAVIGGSSTDRAVELARALNDQTEWHGDRPLFLITTATADKVLLADSPPSYESLIDVYPSRSFRFCFTNRQMADAVIDFVWACGHFGDPGLSVAGLTRACCAGIADLSHVLSALALLDLGRQPTFASVFTLEWADDPFSLDLSNQFRDQLRGRNKANLKGTLRVPYSVGDYHRPNPPEAALVEELLTDLGRGPLSRPLLVVPAGLRPARRFLRTLAAAAPLEIRDAVVLTGDSITFNNIYRDREIAWHIQDIPLPLVFFCHENPVFDPAVSSAYSHGLAPNNGTDDLLLNAIIVEMVLKACFAAPDSSGTRQSVGRAGEMASNLRACRLPEAGVTFFDLAGNRQGGSGEHVVCLQPHRARGRVLPVATLEVWTRRGIENGGSRWRLVKSLRVPYGNAGAEGAAADAEP